MKIDFIKCHGSGNDFILIDELNKSLNLTEENRKSLAIELCDRTGKIGADGILFVQNSSFCDGKMRIFNADGTEPEMCGNGLRCVGRYLIDVLKKDFITVETMKAKYDVKAVSEIFEGVRTVEIEIDTVNFNVNSLPLNHSKDTLINEKIPALSDNLLFTAVSITNPHIVTFINQLSRDEIIRIGKEGNTNKSVFPQGVNANFVKVLEENSIYVTTYERGVGLTKSCGTGMTASSAAYCLNNPNLYCKELNIYNDGGMIKIYVNKDDKNNYKIRFIGNGSYVYSSSANLSDSLKLTSLTDNKDFEEEVASYDKFLNYTKSVIA
ncbi:diaminopimelate epimerase [Clostridium folliculivorans]|uniref:Diaminopimelate epimerase n=1 Tax=Clostridium folliculivorans TaxID=2886038 RepID=A0A9W6D9M3_9CLOT|nr:diaminopimelate epimerase [Clostridium folliculivorans]GKU23808.1 diaminopimelate epimerase [Clostridium folliculivorans]GKU29924.1 diaminopimelate epimerase [Clostridium folliculivorans]